MHIAILGRQSSLSLAELECLYGAEAVTPLGDIAALVDTGTLDVQTLGGSPKVGRVVAELTGDWRHVSQAIERHYSDAWRGIDHKITLGISAYGTRPPSARALQALGLALKKARKHHPGSLRLIPNAESALSTATSHHNKLGLSPHKVELLIVQAPGGTTYLAQSTGAQNITALAARDQARPRTDAFVGMLPPKLALQMINMTGLSSAALQPSSSPSGSSPILPTSAQARESLVPGSRQAEDCLSEASSTGLLESGASGSRSAEAVGKIGELPQHRPTILDPFCGTGVILQEALLMGYSVYGTDLSEKMVDYSQQNLKWLEQQAKYATLHYHVELGDATVHTWQQPIDAVICETYLGQPFSAPPRAEKLREVRGNCNHIISTFLANIAPQLTPGTPLVLAVPAWRDASGHFTHLPLIHQLSDLGYTRRLLHHVRPDQLLYYREDQIVARELLLLTKA